MCMCRGERERERDVPHCFSILTPLSLSTFEIASNIPFSRKLNVCSPDWQKFSFLSNADLLQRYSGIWIHTLNFYLFKLPLLVITFMTFHILTYYGEKNPQSLFNLHNLSFHLWKTSQSPLEELSCVWRWKNTYLIDGLWEICQS